MSINKEQKCGVVRVLIQLPSPSSYDNSTFPLLFLPISPTPYTRIPSEPEQVELCGEKCSEIVKSCW